MSRCNELEKVGKLRELLMKSDTLSAEFEDAPTIVMNKLGLEAVIESESGDISFLSSYMEQIPKGIRLLTLESLVDAFSAIKDVDVSDESLGPRWGVFANVVANANILFNANFSANANAVANANMHANVNANFNGRGAMESSEEFIVPELMPKFFESDLGEYLRELGMTDDRVRALLSQVVNSLEKVSLKDGGERYQFVFRGRNATVNIIKTDGKIFALSGAFESGQVL